jgi:hypothetical protein
MRIIRTPTGAGTPFAPRSRRGRARAKGPADDHGGFSVEEFPYTNDLKRTHEDTEGFLDYLDQFETRKFWFKDANVRNWAFGEDFDNWQNTYGVDGALAVYVATHGGMGTDGNFQVSMGSDWEDRGHFANSFDMRIGNEQCNYVWWSTCESIRIKAGHDPIRSWGSAAQGFRMMFGYETVSYDDGDYGEDFWDEWNEGKSFSTAFLDASWDNSTDQEPSVVAVGATSDEAQDRLFNERLLFWDHVSSNWWWWRWYEKANPARRAPNETLPDEPLIALLERREVDTNYVRNRLRQHKIDLPLPREVRANLRGAFSVRSRQLRASFFGDGAYEVEFRQPNLKNRTSLSEERALSLAEQYVREAKLAQNVDLTFDFVRRGKLAGSDRKRKATVAAHTFESTVEFTQLVNGVPVLSPDRGRVRISLDNDGRVTRIQDDTRPIREMTRAARETNADPKKPIRMHGLDAYRKLLNLGWQRQAKYWRAMGKRASKMRTLPGSEEIGYVVDGNTMALVARAVVEISMPGGFKKRYTLIAPIVK